MIKPTVFNIGNVTSLGNVMEAAAEGIAKSSCDGGSSSGNGGGGFKLVGAADSIPC